MVTIDFGARIFVSVRAWLRDLMISSRKVSELIVVDDGLEHAGEHEEMHAHEVCVAEVYHVVYTHLTALSLIVQVVT